MHNNNSLKCVLVYPSLTHFKSLPGEISMWHSVKKVGNAIRYCSEGNWNSGKVPSVRIPE